MVTEKAHPHGTPPPRDSLIGSYAVGPRIAELTAEGFNLVGITIVTDRVHEFDLPNPSPTFTRERLLASQITERQTFGFMRGMARRVLGPSFDSDLWDRTMRSEEDMESGKPVTPIASPYTTGMLRVGQALAVQDHLDGIDPALEYIAVRAFLNAERLRRLEAAERDVAQGIGIHASQVVAWQAADEDGKRAIVTQAINKVADSGEQGEHAHAMEERLSLFAQMHEFGTHLPLLDNLALVPLLEPGLQEGALRALLPDLPELPDATFHAETIEKVDEEAHSVSPPAPAKRKRRDDSEVRSQPVQIRKERRQGPDTERDMPLSDEEFGNVLASLGNHLGRLLVVMAMQYDLPYSEKMLGREIAGFQNANQGWLSMDSGKNAYAYCRNTLAPIGLMTKVVIRGGHVRFMLSDYGWRMRGMTGHLAVLSEQYPGRSLEDALGNTSSSGGEAKIIATSEGEAEYKRRAALTRFKIFEVLLASDHLPLAQHELVKRLGPDFDRRLVASSLYSLSRSGIITYDSPKSNTRYAYYEPVEHPPGGDPKIYGVRDDLQVVMEYVKTVQGPFTIEDFASVPAHARVMATRNESVTAIFSRLVEQGYLKRAGQGFDSHVHTAIDLSQPQRDFLTALMDTLREVKLGRSEFLAQGSSLVDEILDSQDKARYTRLMRKAQRDSRQANSQSPDKTKEQLVEIIKTAHDASGLIDSDQAQQALNFVFERSYSTRYVGTLLAELAEEGIITRIQKGTKYHYAPGITDRSGEFV